MCTLNSGVEIMETYFYTAHATGKAKCIVPDNQLDGIYSIRKRVYDDLKNRLCPNQKQCNCWLLSDDFIVIGVQEREGVQARDFKVLLEKKE